MNAAVEGYILNLKFDLLIFDSLSFVYHTWCVYLYKIHEIVTMSSR